jgi:hypothetical protein
MTDKKKRYWLKGGITGLIISFIVFIILFTNCIWQMSNCGKGAVIGPNNERPLCASCNLQAYLINLAIFSLLGLVIGLTSGRIYWWVKNRKL